MTPKIVKGYTYQVELNQVVSDTILSNIMWYEGKKLVKEERYWIGEDGRNIERITYTNDGDIKKKEYILNDSTHVQSSEFERDDKGQLTKQILSYNNNTQIINQENIYNKKGQLVETIGRLENMPKAMADKFASYSKCKYDKEGNLIELAQSTKTEKIQLLTFKYDKNANRIEETTISYKDNQKFTTKFFYNNKNQTIKKEVFQNDKWDFTVETNWQNNIIESQKTYYAPYTKEEYHEVVFFEIE